MNLPTSVTQRMASIKFFHKSKISQGDALSTTHRRFPSMDWRETGGRSKGVQQNGKGSPGCEQELLGQGRTSWFMAKRNLGVCCGSTGQ